MRAPILILCFFLLLPAAAAAVDTWEPYPLGARTVEGYLTRYGFGEGRSSGEGVHAFFGPSWGLDDRSHVSLYLGLLSPDKDVPYPGGLDRVSLVYFRSVTPAGGPLALDLFAQIDALGSGLQDSGYAYGCECTLDLPRSGLFLRPSRRVTRSSGEWGSVESALIHWTLGAWLNLGGGQLLAEITGDDENDAYRPNDSIALGLNHPWGETLEVISEYRYWRGHETVDTATWELTLGFVAVW